MTPLTTLALSALISLTGWQPPAHPKSFWQAIADAKFEVPAGSTAGRLAPELVDLLGSPDPVLRDDLAYSILTSWIYRQKLLGPTELEPMLATLEGNLARGIGATGGDGVLRRSFSALMLSVVAARENEAPFMTDAQFRHLLDAGITYVHDERDLRGFDARVGWMHSVAHTADLLKFLARNPRVTRADQARLLAAIADKNRTSPESFSQGEDERMARVVISIVRRSDLDRDGFRSWLTGMQEAAAFPKTPTVESLRAGQNARHLLSSLWTELSVDDRASEGADFARAALRDVLKTLY